MLSMLLRRRAPDAADALNEAARFAMTPAGRRALTRAFEDEAVSLADRLKAAFDAEEVPSAKPRDSTSLPCSCCRTIHDPEAHDA